MDKIIYPSLEKRYFNQMLQVESAEGIYVYSNGKRYIDAISGLWNKNLGHKNEHIRKAVEQQMDRLESINPWISTTDVNVRFADKLLQFADGEFEHVILTCTGAESVEVAIKLARNYQYRKKNSEKKIIASFDIGYHGMSYGAWSVSGIEKGFFPPYSPLVSGTAYLPACVNDTAYEQIEQYFKQYGDRTAALLLEPTIGFGGVFRLQKKYMQGLQKLCRSFDVLLIFDEISTGFYRTGTKFAYKKYGFVPDIMCLSKGINNGVLPLGAVLFQDAVLENMKEDEVFAHITTQNYNPLSSASGLAALELYQEKDYENITETLKKQFEELIEAELSGLILQCRADGLFMALELSERYQDMSRLTFQMKDNGVLTYPFENPYTKGIFLLPMFITQKKEAEEMVLLLKKTLKEL